MSYYRGWQWWSCERNFSGFEELSAMILCCPPWLIFGKRTQIPYCIGISACSRLVPYRFHEARSSHTVLVGVLWANRQNEIYMYKERVSERYLSWPIGSRHPGSWVPSPAVCVSWERQWWHASLELKVQKTQECWCQRTRWLSQLWHMEDFPPSSALVFH